MLAAQGPSLGFVVRQQLIWQLSPVNLDWFKNQNPTLTKFLSKEKNWPSVKRSSNKVKRVSVSTEDC